MMNMFSMFDSNIKMMPLNMMMMIIIMTMKTNNNSFWMNNSYMKMNMNKTFKFMMNNVNNKPLMELFIPLSTLLITMNLMNLIPNIMSPSSMMTFNLSMTLTLWMNMMIMNMKNYKTTLMNLTPKNTPTMMMWIINLIELNSLMFQILSLTMRLSINMMLGHIIMMLMNKMIMMVMYMLVEFMIIMIQSYIFFTLNLLNFNNTN